MPAARALVRLLKPAAKCANVDRARSRYGLPVSEGHRKREVVQNRQCVGMLGALRTSERQKQIVGEITLPGWNVPLVKPVVPGPIKNNPTFVIVSNCEEPFEGSIFWVNKPDVFHKIKDWEWKDV